MNSTNFTLINPQYRVKQDDSGHDKKHVVYKVPTLPAYSISNFSIDKINQSLDGDIQYDSPAIVDDLLIVYGGDRFDQVINPADPLLTIYHFGISDYSLLFPQINEPDLRERVGLFMEEADKAFTQRAWLSFCVMAGGVFEGLLSHLTEDHKMTLGGIVNKVESLAIFDSHQISVLRQVVSFRNHVHAGRYQETTASRSDAMHVRVQLDYFIKMDWNLVIEALRK